MLERKAAMAVPDPRLFELSQLMKRFSFDMNEAAVSLEPNLS